MLKFIAKLFGTKSDKDIKRMMPLVEETKTEGERLKNVSHDLILGGSGQLGVLSLCPH